MCLGAIAEDRSGVLGSKIIENIDQLCLLTIDNKSLAVHSTGQVLLICEQMALSSTSVLQYWNIAVYH